MSIRANLQKQFLIISIFVLVLFITTAASVSGAENIPGADTEITKKSCRQIHAIIRSSQKKFKSIRGKLDLVSEEYFGTLIPLDLKICFAWLNGRTYHCDSRDGMDEAELTKAYDAYIRIFEDCLSDTWQKKEVNIQRANGRRIATFTSAESRVKIKIGERHKRHGWFVDFYFRR